MARQKSIAVLPLEISIPHLYTMEISFYDTWVNDGRKYSDAIAIYSEHGTNATLKELFAKGETSYTRAKIAFEIKALGNIPERSPGEVEGSAFKTYVEPNKRVDSRNFPDSLKSEYIKLGPLIARMRFLHSRLDIIQNDDDRCTAALEIVSCSEKRREIFNKIDYFQEHGKIMPVAQNTITEEKEILASEDESGELKKLRLERELTLLRSRKSKLVKQPHNQSKLNGVITRMAEIKKDIDGIV